jgi:hypothetical protein
VHGVTHPLTHAGTHATHRQMGAGKSEGRYRLSWFCSVVCSFWWALVSCLSCKSGDSGVFVWGKLQALGVREQCVVTVLARCLSLSWRSSSRFMFATAPCLRCHRLR